MRSLVLRTAQRLPGPVRRLLLRLTLGGPRGRGERALLAAWHATRPLRAPRRTAPAHGAGAVVVDAWAAGPELLGEHVAAAADALGMGPVSLLWLVSSDDFRVVTAHGWLVDHVSAGEGVEYASRLRLLDRTLSAATHVALPQEPSVDAWRDLLPRPTPTVEGLDQASSRR